MTRPVPTWSADSPFRVLVIGGYGLFGGRLVHRLARWPELAVVVAGRSLLAAEGLVQTLRVSAAARLTASAIDAEAPSLAQDIARLAPHVVVHTGGPFQRQDHHVARACIEAGAHYIDLADARAFVAGIGTLDAAARRAGVAVVSGASSVPGLSSAVADMLAAGLAAVNRIDIGISPGNRTERGTSTVRAILSYCGRALPDAGAGREFGWCGVREHSYPPPVGRRLLSPCDVPDLALLPGRYPGRPQVQFGAGLELRMLHRGMNLLAWLARRGLVADWSRHAGLLKRLGDLCRHLGSDAGAMHVAVEGLDANGRTCARGWSLVATHGDGPYVPTLAAAALIRRLQAGGDDLVGARPCVGLVSLAEFERASEGLRITMGKTLP